MNLPLHTAIEISARKHTQHIQAQHTFQDNAFEIGQNECSLEIVIIVFRSAISLKNMFEMVLKCTYNVYTESPRKHLRSRSEKL